MNTVMKNLCKHINRAGMALLLVLSACSDDGLSELSGLPVKADAERVPLRVAGATAGNGISVQTRADARQELQSGSIGIFLKEDVANGYAALTNQKFSYGTPFWQTDEQILLGEQNATLAAYYPYSIGRVNPVMLHCQRYSADEDLHYVNFEANSGVSDVTLNLSRIYSRIVFNFTGHPAYTGAGKVTAIHFSGDGIVPVAMLDMFDLTVSGVVGRTIRDILDPFTGLHAAEVTGFTTDFKATDAEKKKADCLMIPAQLTSDITFTITVDGLEMEGTVTPEQLCGSGGILMEGVKYEVNINVKPTRLEIGSISKTEWEPVDVDGDYVIQ